MILSLCRTFHVLPSQLLREDASLLRLITIEQLARKEESPDG